MQAAESRPASRPSLDTTPRGTRFVAPEIEREYLVWQREHSVPFNRAGAYLTIPFWAGSALALWAQNARRSALAIALVIEPLLFFALPAGGFFSIALLMAFFNVLERRASGGKTAAPSTGGSHGQAA